MRLVKWADYDIDELLPEDRDDNVEDSGVAFVDRKARADIILALVDEQLAKFDLEIVMYEHDEYLWKIEPRVSEVGDAIYKTGTGVVAVSRTA